MHMNFLVSGAGVKGLMPSGEGPVARRRWMQYVDLLSHLVWRDFSLRYKQSLLGVLWSLLLPLAQLLVLVFLFQSVVPLNIDAYPAFVFTALLPWSWFNSSVGSSCNLFVSNRDLMRRPDFRPSLLMVVNTLSNLLAYLVALPILFVMLAAYGITLTPALLCFPVLVLIQGVFTVGLNLIVATVNVYFRDVQHIISVLLTLLFYLTPVFYRPQAIVQQYQALYSLNPITVLLQSYRAIFLYGVMPPWQSLVFAAVSAVVIWLLGSIIYYSRADEIIDLI
jgi:ABC-type polysaccharide/polyol phosphate export permease